MTERADQGAAIADDRIGDQGSGRGHGRLLAREKCGALQVSVAAERADANGAVGIRAVIVEARQVVDVDDQVRRRETQLHQRYQALEIGRAHV